MRHFSRISHIPPLSQFINPVLNSAIPVPEKLTDLKYYLQTYGCAMNENDSQIVSSILHSAGLKSTDTSDKADLVLINTCSIREKAEQKVKQRLHELLKQNKRAKIAVLGCMAERLKSSLLEEKLAHIVVGPDSYRALPKLVEAVMCDGKKNAIDVQLSLEETYADITPVRNNEISAFISIMRGCNNMCSFCVVPFTRGRERSRPMASILEEVKLLHSKGIKEITLLGQNVNSYCDTTSDSVNSHENTPGFSELFKSRPSGARFAQLLANVAEEAPNSRIRFTSPHPKDFPQEVLDVMKAYPNLCKQVHLPLQSGSDRILYSMRRYHTQQAYLDLAERIRNELPGVALSTDVIAGFCGETEEDHQETLKVLRTVRFEQAYMFAYSMRSKTHAFNAMQDDVKEDVKKGRLAEIIEVVKEIQKEINQKEIGKTVKVMVDGPALKGNWDWTGRTEQNKRTFGKGSWKLGQDIEARVVSASSQTLFTEEL
ncbi:CDK5RAP1 [Blepharisma stoltei]|uniref:Uncharacterized protein n=1 Tax=Blepharisma stoltei TaxID=1481888 RepID=A0AAU9KAL8_9CILI|nr:unnamed protein product [Blepharisma stoltei]